MSRQAGSVFSGDFRAAPDIRQSGPAAGGACVLRTGEKVKVGRNRAWNQEPIGNGAYDQPYSDGKIEGFGRQDWQGYAPETRIDAQPLGSR